MSWEPEELATAARLLIKEGDGDGAARFLYTLVARGQLEKGSPVRARVLYQLFDLLSDAGDERLALTRGDLRFYRDVAASDPHPGMLGGVLSLIFSGENSAREMKKEDEAAVYDFCVQLHRARKVDDANFKRVKALFGEQGVIDLIGVSGYYTAVSMTLNVAQVPVPGGVNPLKPLE